MSPPALDTVVPAGGQPMLTLLSVADYRRVRWKNGRGWTTELAAWPASGEFSWRVSIAEIDADCEFSVFPGIDRSILVLDGDGMTLQVGSGPPHTLRAGSGPLAFPGDLPAKAQLLGGPTRDFNVMTRRGVVGHDLRCLSLDESPELDCPAGGGWLIHVMGGHARIGTLQAAVGECVVAAPGDDAGPSVTVCGAGEALLVRLWPSLVAC